ncbi:site-2 protease family protein [Phreatobacter sp. AB_2022a]|uniref:site-2 protease family protein n=1 Tax=Phreatobacter sp. AB_2022a TaxID=3003134 RepID=UPI002286E61C|nr:site-2 protease family protein [Phreatobacter sp. AB_2022a]MCZ0738581.1 site-2 protease family protein [Phreatobacter sp. AB_2022a]
MDVPGSDRHGSFAGVPVHWHGTLILIPLFLGMQFQRFGLVAGGLLTLVLTLALVGSILLHEAAHVRAARHVGVGAQAIVLHGFGGIALIDAVPMPPRHRILIALAGPLANLALALAGCGLLQIAEWALVPAVSEQAGAYGLTLPLARSLSGNAVLAGLKTFATLNLLLGTVNLLPAFPLDGGVIARTLASLRLGPSQAVRVTAVLGLVSIPLAGHAVGLAGLGASISGFGAFALVLLLIAVNGWALWQPAAFLPDQAGQACG